MSNRVRPLQWWSGGNINNCNMAFMWPFYVQVLLSYSCSCTCLGFDDLFGNGNAPAGYRWMMMDQILRTFDPKTYTIMPFDVAMASGRLQGGAGGSGSGKARKTSARSLPARSGSRGLPARTGSRGLKTDGEEIPVQKKDDDGGAPARTIDVEETELPSTPPADDSVVQVKDMAVNRQTAEKIKQQNRNKVRKKKPNTNLNTITAVKVDEGDQHERRKRAFFAPDSLPPLPTPRQTSDGDARNDDYDRDFRVIGGDNEDIWRQDAVVVAVVVDPGRRVRMFSRVDGDDDDGTVSAVDASMIDAESSVDTAVADDPSAEPDGVLEISAPYSPVVDKLARPILPDIRSHQILPSTLNAAHATSDAVELHHLQTAATRDNDMLQLTQTPVTSMGTAVPTKPVNGLDNYANDSIFDTWKTFFSYNYQYFQSLSDPNDSNSLVRQQLVYEGEMYDNKLKDNYGVSEYVSDDDVDHNYDDDKCTAVSDGVEGIDCNDDSSYEVDNSEQYNREVYVYNSDDNDSEVSNLNEMMQSKQLLKT